MASRACQGISHSPALSPLHWTARSSSVCNAVGTVKYFNDSASCDLDWAMGLIQHEDGWQQVTPLCHHPSDSVVGSSRSAPGVGGGVAPCLSMASSQCPCELWTVPGLQTHPCVAYLEEDKLSKGQMPLEAQHVPRIRKSLELSLGPLAHLHAG